jgi:hypothetical protein
VTFRLAFLVIPLLAAACDSRESRYPTLQDARADRLFERGWLPDMLPPSASDIVTVNNLDLNRSRGQFSFTPPEFESFRELLSPLAPEGAARWDTIAAEVETHTAEGYPVYSHREAEREWVFLCIPEQGFCRYHMS